uniref:Large ribosomal subunit protein bL9m n=1 Tax=Timema cristinae TaxID=61476 RepID=A0A7R9D473_TIMCR|nr:unnamed protein product [Timema cristinae]
MHKIEHEILSGPLGHVGGEKKPLLYLVNNGLTLRTTIPASKGAKCSISPLLRDGSALNVIQQSRTTFILRRKTTPSLHKKGKPQQKLRARHFIYELVEDTNTRKHNKMEIILTDYVSGLGARGDKVSVKPNFAYNNLLLPGLAVYSTPENSEKYCTPQEESIKPKFSSPYASRTVGFLSKMTLAIVMNKEIPWKLEPWHIRMSFRKAGVDVAEHAIELPEKPIKGPNLDLECKIFFVTITWSVVNPDQSGPGPIRITELSGFSNVLSITVYICNVLTRGYMTLGSLLYCKIEAKGFYNTF